MFQLRFLFFWRPYLKWRHIASLQDSTEHSMTGRLAPSITTKLYDTQESSQHYHKADAKLSPSLFTPSLSRSWSALSFLWSEPSWYSYNPAHPPCLLTLPHIFHQWPHPGLCGGACAHLHEVCLPWSPFPCCWFSQVHLPLLLYSVPVLE